MINYKTLVQSLSDPEITKRNYDAAIEAIGAKVNEIWLYICKTSKRNMSWWAFQNDVYDGNGDGSSGGSFNPHTDANFISIEGDADDFHQTNCNYFYNEGFPTELLWTDNWQEVVDKHIAVVIDLYNKEQKAKEEKKAQKKLEDKEKEQQRRQMLQSIKEKTKGVLTKDEFNFMINKLYFGQNHY